MIKQIVGSRVFEFGEEHFALFMCIQQEIVEDKCVQINSSIQGSRRKAGLVLNSL